MEQEYLDLDTAIREEKDKQLGSMRNALLERKVAKERKRKQRALEEEEKKRRAAVARMNTGMAKAFTEMIQKAKAEVEASRTTEKTQGRNQLKAKLAKWQR